MLKTILYRFDLLAKKCPFFRERQMIFEPNRGELGSCLVPGKNCIQDECPFIYWLTNLTNLEVKEADK